MENQNSVIGNVKTGGKKRVYHYMACNKSGHLESGYVWSDLKIRAVAALLFKEFFTHAPSESWGKNGFMGGALNKRGDDVTLDQINMNHAEWAKAGMTV